MNDSNTTCYPVFDFFESNGDLTTNSVVIWAFICTYTLIFIAGITGNLFVISAVARNKALQSVRNIFIVNLSCSDLTVCFSSLIVTPTAALIKLWPFGSALCSIIPWFQGTNLLISTFTLSCIAIDRYILILHPTSRPISKNQAIGLIIFIWVLALVSAFPVFLFNEYAEFMKYSLNGVDYCGPTCGERWPHKWLNKAYGGIILFMQFILPLALITFCYSKILHTLAHGISNKRNKEKMNGEQILSERELLAIRKRRRTNRMLISMVVLFACCWFPNILIRVLLDFGVLALSTRYVFIFPLVVHCIAMTSVFWNPILYGWFNDQFRKAFLQLLPCLKPEADTNQRQIPIMEDTPSLMPRVNHLTANRKLQYENGRKDVTGGTSSVNDCLL